MPNSELERVQERHAQDMARRSGPDDDRLDSEKVVVAAPFSYAGSAQRIWPYFKRRADGAQQRSDETRDALLALGWSTLGALTIGLAWFGVTCWYTIFGLLVVPYRLIRRGQRKRQVEALRQRELLAAVADGPSAKEGQS
jgi:hypothetical protein